MHTKESETSSYNLRVVYPKMYCNNTKLAIEKYNLIRKTKKMN